ncbi:MAG: hypothetical protein HN531_07100 [Opitutae bacterium]|nr:hypothetical protein [Opitutae bacterium]
MKKFQESKVVLPSGQDQWERGVLRVFAQGIELAYEKGRREDLGVVESLVLHPSEVDGIAYMLRPAPAPDTRAGVEWERELERIRIPSFRDTVIRAALNFYNMLRDAFGQASQAILGAISKDSSMGKVKNADKHANEIGSGLTDLVPNAWEPILEKYRGHQVVVERKTKSGLIKESGVLEDYSSKYILLREVVVRDEKLLDYLEKQGAKRDAKNDILYSRSNAIVRHTVSNF